LSAARGVRVRALDVPGVMPRPKKQQSTTFFSIVIVISEVSNSVSYGRTVTLRVRARVMYYERANLGDIGIFLGYGEPGVNEPRI
jgi:hypothetical protein